MRTLARRADNVKVPERIGAQSPPNGTVVFLFTDIEGSTGRWERYPEAMEAAIHRHDAIVSATIAARGGHVFKTLGDAVYAAFSSAVDALHAAVDTQRALAAADWTAVGGLRVRVAIHVGVAESRDADYFGRPLNRTARILGAGHGGQILISSAVEVLVRDRLEDGFSLRNLGLHGLKDLEQAESIFQLVTPDLPSDFPRLHSLQYRPNNLPIQPTRFIGRARELAELRDRFKDTRLLTLLGFGGVGKSRLALQLAAESVERFTDGVWYLDLSAIANPEIVADETARTIGAPPARDENSVQTVLETLGDKTTLLVFDGCEHLLHAVAAIITAILRACPNVCIIATTRQALDVPGETIQHVDTLDVPPASVTTAEEAASYTAVQLFVERCTAISERFELNDANAAVVGEICRRLDGIALALELAAPRIAVLTPRQLADRLRERFRLLTGGRQGAVPRQQTLRALIDWSFDLLTEDERTVFRRLSIFASSWTLDAATALCADAAIDEWRTFDVCSALVAKSLVVAEPSLDVRRFRLLDSIRDYGREKLAEAGEGDLAADRLARYYVGYLSGLQPCVDGDDEDAWRAQVEPEIDNIRKALEWSLVLGNDRHTGRALLVHFEWPQSVATPREAIAWFDLAAQGDEPFASAFDQARFSAHYARLAWLVGRPIAWREAIATKTLLAARASGEPVALALALNVLGSVHLDGGRHADADALFEEAQRLADLPPKIRKHLMRDRAINDLERGELILARERFGRVAQMERTGSIGHGVALLNLAELDFAAGDFDAARKSGRAAKEVLERLHAAPLALLACNRAAYEMAADALDDARAALREALDRSRESGQFWALTAIEHHAVFCGLIGDLETALLLLGHTDAQVKSVGGTRKCTERYGYERLARILHEAHGDALHARLEPGAHLTRDQAFVLAETIHTAKLDRTA